MAKEKDKEKKEEHEKEEHAEKRKAKAKEVRINTETVKLALVGLLALIAIINLALLVNVEKTINDRIEFSKPAKLNVVSIFSESCDKCLDTSLAVEAIKEQGFTVAKDEKFEINSKEAKSLISKYSIKSVPAVIITGEISKAAALEQFTEKVNGALVFQSMQPPYVDASTGKVAGYVALTILSDKSCSQCYNATDHRKILYGNFGVVVSSEKMLDVSSDEGKQILLKYNISKVPTVIISKEVSLYSGIQEVWPSVGTIEADGSYVFRNFGAWPGQTYKDLTNNSILKS